MIHKIEETFWCKGEVSGYHFIKLKETEHAYLYQKNEYGTNNSSYEVFIKKATPVCLDFDNRVYSDTEFKHTYPKSNSFGVWAWDYLNFDKALVKIENLTLEQILKNEKVQK